MGVDGELSAKRAKPLSDGCGLGYSHVFCFSGQKLWAQAEYAYTHVSIYHTCMEHTLCARHFSKQFKNINVN